MTSEEQKLLDLAFDQSVLLDQAIRIITDALKLIDVLWDRVGDIPDPVEDQRVDILEAAVRFRKQVRR